eukprot:5038548-Prorocentrum_lima.AAC.1
MVHFGHDHCAATAASRPAAWVASASKQPMSSAPDSPSRGSSASFPVSSLLCSKTAVTFAV